MARVVGAGVIGLVAPIAIIRNAGEVAVRVALRTRDADVGSGKCERRVVIERRRTPSGGGMTHRTARRKARREMVGAGGGAEISLMAGIAISWRGLIIVVGVSLCATDGSVLALQRPVSIGEVVECGIAPVRCGVAGAALAG